MTTQREWEKIQENDERTKIAQDQLREYEYEKERVEKMEEIKNE